MVKSVRTVKVWANCAKPKSYHKVHVGAKLQMSVKKLANEKLTKKEANVVASVEVFCAEQVCI